MGALFGIRLGDVLEAKVDGTVIEILKSHNSPISIMIENGPHEWQKIGPCGEMSDHGCFSGAAMAPLKVSLVSGVRSMRIPSHQFSPDSGWAGVLSKRNPS